MRDEIDERVLRERCVLRLEVGHVRHVVVLEDAHRVIAEALVQLFELAVRRGVGAQLEHASALRVRDRLARHDAASEKSQNERGADDGRSPHRLHSSSYARTCASMTLSGDSVGTMRVSSKPARAKRSANSAAVRSRPPGINNISRSISLPKSGTLPG